MTETVYQEPGSQPQGRAAGPVAQDPLAARRRQRERRSLATLIAAVVVLAAVIVYWLRPKPAPVILGAAGERSIALSENGKLLAVATRDGFLRLLSPESGHTLARAQLPAPAIAVAFGPQGEVLALEPEQLLIFSADLSRSAGREVQANATDMIWSPALDEAVVASGGTDNLHPAMEFFPEQPLGLEHSTSQLFDLREWQPPVRLAASADGSRLGLTLTGNRLANVIFYDPARRRVVGSLRLAGGADGIALAADAHRAWVVSPQAESISEISGRATVSTGYPKSASTSPVRMIAVNEATRRACTTGSLTFPDVDLDLRRIARTFELPARSAGLVLSADGATAYLTFDSNNRVGVLDLRDMKSYRELELR